MYSPRAHIRMRPRGRRNPNTIYSFGVKCSSIMSLINSFIIFCLIVVWFVSCFGMCKVNISLLYLQVIVVLCLFLLQKNLQHYLSQAMLQKKQ